METFLRSIVGRPRRTWSVPAVLLAALLVPLGCSSGERQANIALRKQVQDLEARIADLNRGRDADQATIKSMQASVPAVPTLPQERLSTLFTTSGLSLLRLTGGADVDANKPGDEGLKIYVVPLDETGDELKAAGKFTVEAFDLADAGKQVGKWEFDQATTRAAWNGAALLYEYVLFCPWQSVPTHAELTLKVTFTDELTARQFTQQKPVTVKLPGA